MMYFFVILIICSTLGASTNKDTGNNVSYNDEKEPISLKITKSVDLQITENNKKNWDNDLNNNIQPEISKTIPERYNESQSVQSNLGIDVGNKAPNEELVRVKRDFTQDEKLDIIKSRLGHLINKVRHIEENCDKSDSQSSSNVGNIEINYSELCKRSVGISKLEPCELIDEEHLALSTEKDIPKSCKEIQETGQNKSGIYEIQPKNSLKPFWALCDMETRGGGWTVIQKRYDGSEDFYREWRDYKFGFGKLKGEFWLGLENIYHITGFEVSELLVEIMDRDNVKAFAHYSKFGIGPEIDGYDLKVLKGFSGDAGDSLTPHLSSKFSTKDLDQDSDSNNCAQVHLGGWWYKACQVSNLNGKYINVPLPEQYKFKGLHWLAYRGPEYCHAGSRMLVRPAQS